MKIGKRDFITDGSEIFFMGILNITADSFSDGGRYLDPENALRQAEKLVREGADILDLGAESTRPGYQPISTEMETERLCRMIELLKKELDIPLSVDTCKAEVMDAALSAGADLANDIWGLRYEEMHPEEQEDKGRKPSMAEVIARHGKPAVIMHNDLLGRVEEERTEAMFGNSGVSAEAVNDVFLRVRQGLQRSVEIAEKAGISGERLILDPGIGFAKSTRESLILLNRMKELRQEGECWLLAASRKSVIGDVLQLPVNEREEGTMVTSILAADAGFSFLRVHEITPSLRGVKMLRGIRKSAE